MTIVKILSLMTLIILSSCASNYSSDSEIYKKVTSISLSDMESAIQNKEVASVIDVLKRARPLAKREIDVEVNASSSDLVKINGKSYLAEAYSIAGLDIYSLHVSSYVVPVEDNPDYLFFPVLSQYDAEFKLIETTYASDDYLIRQGALRTSYRLAPSASYILFHTDDKYLTIGSMDGEKGGLSPVGEYSSVDISGAVVVASILGGAIGGAIAGGLAGASFDYESAPPENFYFGSGGIFDINATKKSITN